MTHSPRFERDQLRRQGMRGYAVCLGFEWTATLYTRLARAERAAQGCPNARVYLVRTDGKLYIQDAGRAVAPVTDPFDATRIAGIDLRLARRAKTPRATSAAPARMGR